jgi:RNA polymerase sigma factor for flagellar operon FliA
MSVAPKPGADRLVETFRSYSHALAAELQRKYPGVDRDELRSAADLGLVEAANSFDPSRGVLFKTFAYYRIRGAIYDSLRKMGWFAKDPARLRFESGANEYLKDYTETSNENGSPDGAAEELQDIASSVVNCYFLSMSSMTEELPQTGVKSPEERVAEAELRDRLRKAVTGLPAKNRQVLEEYYFRNSTLEDIGARLGLSKSWVSRLHAKSLEMVRAALEKEGIRGSSASSKQLLPTGGDK